MSKKITGILGYGGYIGRYATEKLLQLGFEVIGGQRKEENLFAKYENFTFVYVDVKDESLLQAFIQKCDVIVNCISPSHLYGKLVKDAVCQYHKIYIDPSDASFEQDRRHVTGKCVASCGYIPGLSEFLPYVLAKEHFDHVYRCVMYQGGFDGCSPGSFVDMILGAGNQNFYGDAYLQNGKITPLSFDIKQSHATPFSERKVIFKPLINADSMTLQKALHADAFYFFCTYDDMATLGFFMKLLVEVSKYNKETAAENIERKLKERIQTNENFGNQTVGAFLFFELWGEKNGTEKAVTCKLFLKNVNRVCGYFLAETVKEVLAYPEKITDGFHVGFTLLQRDYAQRILAEIGEDEYIQTEEIRPEDKMCIEAFTKQKCDLKK